MIEQLRGATFGTVLDNQRNAIGIQEKASLPSYAVDQNEASGAAAAAVPTCDHQCI